MIVIIEFRVKFFLKEVGFKNIGFFRLQNNIHDLLVMFEKQGIPTKLQRRNSSLKYESLNHEVIVYLIL